MSRTAKWQGKTYEVKSTGKVRYSKAKSYTDFNGYDTDKPAFKTEQLGMYDEHGYKVATVNEAGHIFQGCGKPVGSTKIKNS
jgi:hypothetical protein